MNSKVLRCDGCGVRVARVRDTRFGLAPAGSLCVACTSPAWARALGPRARPLVIARAR